MSQNFEAPDRGSETRDQQLDMLRVKLETQTYPGYPALDQRLAIDLADLESAPDGRLVIPDGPWTVNGHPNRPHGASQPTPDEQAALSQRGLQLDSQGRPLHPWFRHMVEDPSIGVVTGKGYYYEWGENRTVDAIVVRNGEEVLLVKRKDTGNMAFPGGFKDEDDGKAGAVRELEEESGIVIADPSVGIPVYNGLIVDTRITANAWTATEAFIFHVGSETPDPVAADDAAEADWFPIPQVREHETMLFGAHRVLFHKALEQL